MAYTAPTDAFRFAEYRRAAEGRRVLITGAGKDGGIGQAFALSAGLNGAASVGVHFHRSYEDGFDLVDRLRDEGVHAFPVQADVTNLRDLWAIRSYVMDQMGGLPPDLVICNSGLTESGYNLGRTLRPVEGESTSLRRARVRQHFIDNLEQSRLVLDTKVDGFLASTHLWAGEAVYAGTPAQIVYVSSRQAVDPGPAVPGYALSNWAVLQLPKVLKVNLGRSADLVSCFTLLLPFVRTGMTNEYAGNERVFGRWQPRMLEPYEMAKAFMALLARPTEETDGAMYELTVYAASDADQSDPATSSAVELFWNRLTLSLDQQPVHWSQANPLHFT
ncbi:SDR family NAD(P)-dependent oxidoreductase [Candidatus Poriferisodalis sp.]|uniref:SDR family NAD(P)-dependent oxidoreductase n=1 Tax=Candidatus Poriferisodalis sp. TaxID=3101277 RepID=UPI003B02013E